MKSSLKVANRLTDKEKDVIEWAFNLAYSTIAGDYRMPQPMCYAINYLQDAVFALAQERAISVKDGCSEEFLSYSKGYNDALEEKLKASVDALEDSINALEEKQEKLKASII